MVGAGPHMNILFYHGYPTNDYYFYIKVYDNNFNIQNSGVILVAQSMYISSTKDNKPVFANMSYYGVIEDIWELDYTMFLFSCSSVSGWRIIMA